MQPMGAGSAGHPRLQVGTLEIAWEQAGEGGRPLVLVHGYTGSRDDWREQLPRLGALGRTVALDQRGHGESTNTGDARSYSFEQLVTDLVGALDSLEIERCDLLGHSMGGMVALRTALEYPDRVASLVLMDTAPGPVRLLPPEVRRVGAELVRQHGLTALARVMRARGGDPKRPAPAAACEARMGSDVFWGRIETKLEQMDPVAFMALGELMGSQPSLADRLGEISCPTLVVVGAEDSVFLAPAEELERGIPGAVRVTIDGAAHSPQLENPTAWFAAIREHLERARG